MLIDAKTLLEHLENDLDTLKDIHELFCEESESGKADLQNAFDSNDLAGIKRSAHMLKGMMANLAAQSTCDLLSQLEELDSENGIYGSRKLLEKLNEDVKQIDSELRQIIASGGVTG